MKDKTLSSNYSFKRNDLAVHAGLILLYVCSECSTKKCTGHGYRSKW